MHDRCSPPLISFSRKFREPHPPDFRTVGPHDGGVATITARQARFVNLDGKVQVKKVNSVTMGERRLSAHPGQRRPDPDRIPKASRASLSPTEPPTRSRATRWSPWKKTTSRRISASQVGVHISSGQVDLATGTWEVPGSKAEVSFENAVASLRENSRAAVQQRSGNEAAGNYRIFRKRRIESRQRSSGYRHSGNESHFPPADRSPSPRCWRLRNWSSR